MTTLYAPGELPLYIFIGIYRENLLDTIQTYAKKELSLLLIAYRQMLHKPKSAHNHLRNADATLNTLYGLVQEEGADFVGRGGGDLGSAAVLSLMWL